MRRISGATWICRTVGASALAAAMLTVLPGAGQAHAGADGIEFVPAFRISQLGVDIPIPAGALEHVIEGEGRRIESQVAEYRATVPISGLIALKGRVCNWQIDFSYKDSRTGKEYLRERGKAIPECGGLLHGLRGKAKPKTLPEFGKACAELWVNGKFRAAQCHSITR
jgi:hypothetical protein